jgi:hypothetical protein
MTTRLCLIASICLSLSASAGQNGPNLRQAALYGADKPAPRVPPTPQAQTCSRALQACLELSQAQDASIANLKANNQALADQLATASAPPLIPTWAVISLSVLAGTVIGLKLK